MGSEVFARIHLRMPLGPMGRVSGCQAGQQLSIPTVTSSCDSAAAHGHAAILPCNHPLQSRSRHCSLSSCQLDAASCQPNLWPQGELRAAGTERDGQRAQPGALWYL